MEKMDKVSAALLMGIMAMAVISCVIVYRTWIVSEESSDYVEALNIQDIDNTELVFNDDTSITNNSSRRLWLRVRVIYYEAYEDEKYDIVSEAVNSGYWTLERDDWYYCEKALDFSERTEPLIDQLIYGSKNVMEDGNKKFRLQAEAIDEAWLLSKPGCAQEAFNLFKEVREKGGQIYL